MPVLTAARSGLARAGATRAGYPIAQGVVMPRYALSGVARSGATRSNYHSPKVFVAIAGVHYATARAVTAQKVLNETLSITDTLNETPNTASCTTKGFIPIEGQEVVITLGSKNNLVREFGGQLLSTVLSYSGTPGNFRHALSLIDYTWGLNKRKVRKRYTSTTVAVIAADLIAIYAPGYTVQIAADIGAEPIDVITFTETDLTACLSQLTKRVDGNWKCDYHKVVKLFYEDVSDTPPTILNAVHLTLEHVSLFRDLSQILTRVYVEGGGANAFAALGVGETILPLDGDPTWYSAGGGVVVCGPQRLTYTGVNASSGGGLVGTGAAPSGPPSLVLASGAAGVETGSHDYAVTFITAAGESIPGPPGTIAVGLTPEPTTAPIAAVPTIGTGPDPGEHEYAVTFVTSTGETIAGPIEATATTETAHPGTTPTPTVAAGAGVDDGNHDYAVTFVTAIGETTPGPISVQATTSGTDTPATAVTVATGGDGASLTVGAVYKWRVTFVTALGETDGSPASADYTAQSAPGGFSKSALLSNVAIGPADVTARKLYRTLGNGSTYYYRDTIPDNTTTTYQLQSGPGAYFGDGTADSGISANPTIPATNTLIRRQILLTAIPLGDTNVTSRKLYRRSGGAGLKLLATIANNFTTTYTDTTSNASLGAAVPSTTTAYLQRIALSAIPIGSALVTSRKVYRTAAGGSQLKLLTTLANNTTTVFTDTVTDASLGANVPTTNTATANQVALTSIPIGAASVTQRKIYRTAVGSAQLKLLATIADNVTSTYADTIADASLGANVPTADTSGLNQPQGNVIAGSTSLQIASIGPFPQTGWAVIGNGQQIIRYTGISGNVLTGIPASGPGAIIASISYNSTVTAAPSLTGIPASGLGSILYPILKGDEVNLFVQVDDVPAQAALAALIGGDGIQEDSLQDRRLGYTEAVAKGAAWLARHRDIDLSLRYQSRDLNTRTGRTVPVNLGPPFNLTTDFLIQSVTESGFAPARNPTFAVVAAAGRVTFDDLMRALKKAA